eukprot:PhF_6_TR43390/c0_g1_i3/m.66603
MNHAEVAVDTTATPSRYGVGANIHGNVVFPPSSPCDAGCTTHALCQLTCDRKDMHAVVKDIEANMIKEITTSLLGDQRRILLELLQNADDCTYPADVVPTMIVEISAHDMDDRVTTISITTNEVGMTKGNVVSMC